MAIFTYTTWGPVRGDCGHRHHSIRAAERCLASDRQGCASQGGSSDREIWVLDPDDLDTYDLARGPGPGEPLDSGDDLVTW